jgi:hypothetical protein
MSALHAAQKAASAALLKEGNRFILSFFRVSVVQNHWHILARASSLTK